LRCNGDLVRCDGDLVRCDGDLVRCDGDWVRCCGDLVHTGDEHALVWLTFSDYLWCRQFLVGVVLAPGASGDKSYLLVCRFLSRSKLMY